MVATAIIGSGLIGGAASIFGSQAAAKAQTSASNNATAAQMRMFDVTRAGLQPFIDLGKEGAGAFMQGLPGITAPINLTEDWLQNTPGYKWNLAQGLKSVYNSASARGLGASGAAIKGGAAYTTGLADSTYQNQFSNELAQRALRLQALATPLSIGENAAAGLGNAATTVGGQVGANIIGAGNARAAADIAGANAVGGMGNALAQAMIGKQLGLF